jgi:hypothetical protein
VRTLYLANLTNCTLDGMQIKDGYTRVNDSTGDPQNYGGGCVYQ